MRKLVLAFCFAIGGFVMYAQDTTSTDMTQTQQQYPTTQNNQDDRERINSRDLPDPIKRSLETQDYRGWLINSAYKTTGLSMNGQPAEMPSDSTSAGAYGQEIYVVEMKNGAQTKTVRFDKDGNRLDDQGTDNDQR